MRRKMKNRMRMRMKKKNMITYLEILPLVLSTLRT